MQGSVVPLFFQHGMYMQLNGNCFIVLMYFLLNQRPNSAIILEGQPEPGLLAMLPVS